MLLAWRGQRDDNGWPIAAAVAIVTAVERALGDQATRTPDPAGGDDTLELVNALAAYISS